jgi:hypothetical protein
VFFGDVRKDEHDFEEFHRAELTGAVSGEDDFVAGAHVCIRRRSGISCGGNSHGGRPKLVSYFEHFEHFHISCMGESTISYPTLAAKTKTRRGWGTQWLIR